jgi:hypothetical protein
MLMVSYIRRFETGTIARKNGAIARKSVTRPRSRGVAVRNPAVAHRLGLVGGAERRYSEAETGIYSWGCRYK